MTLPALRLAIARGCVVLCFFWPFFNYDLVVPGCTVEINFLPVFAAALILPEIFLLDLPSLLLTLPAYLIALIFSAPTSPARLMIALVPLHIIFNLTRRLRENGEELIPALWAFRGLKIFVLFSVAQMIQMHFLRILPGTLLNLLVAVVPRYFTLPYDDLGTHGVQGWASEPSSAGLTTIAFALVAIQQRPEWKWRVMSWFAVLVLVNKSIYAIVLGILLLTACLGNLRRKWIAFAGIIPAAAIVGFYLSISGRVAKLSENIAIDGLQTESNHELARFVQILSPLQQFPQIYKPVILFGSWVMEPMGLLPLCVGYGSLFGILWLLYILFKNFPISQVKERGFWLVAAFVLFIMASPDLICSIVALAAFMVVKKAKSADEVTGPLSLSRPTIIAEAG
jgi:hypothetical protein